MFARLQLYNWRQFDTIDLRFHPRLTVLTGANGAGKTTILNLLNRHFGWNLNFVSTPKTLKGVLRYASDFWKTLPLELSPPRANEHAIGEIEYSDGGCALLRVPDNVSHACTVSIVHQQKVSGTFIPSHRPVFFYQPVTQIPTQLNAREQVATGLHE